MALYQYASPSLIASVEVARTARAPKSKEPITYEAVLFTPEGKEESLVRAMECLTAQGQMCQLAVVDKKPALRVKGLKNETSILSMLQEGNITAGEPTKEPAYQVHITA